MGSPARQYMGDFLVTRLPLGDYPIKEARQRGLSNNLEGKGGESEEELRELEAMRILAEDELSSRNYSDKLQLLLHIEQVKEEKEVRQLDMSGVEVKVERKTGLVVVEVPHLQEGRLHTLRGDKLFLRRAGDQIVEYETFVHKVTESKVWLGGDQQLVQKIVPGSRWDIRFSVNLHPARLKHRALSLASTLGMVTGIEMFHKILEEANAGDQMGLLARGIKSQDVTRGMCVVKPKSVKAADHFVAQVYL